LPASHHRQFVALLVGRDRLGGIDIVIDDGSHVGRHQIASFEFLYPRLSERGIYVCEDLHCSYWPTHEGGLRRDGTFAEYTKALIDRSQAWYLVGEAQAAAMPFAETAYGIFVYLDLVIIEKRPVSRPFHAQMGGLLNSVEVCRGSDADAG
jgi:hypothetical protein